MPTIHTRIKPTRQKPDTNNIGGPHQQEHQHTNTRTKNYRMTRRTPLLLLLVRGYDMTRYDSTTTARYPTRKDRERERKRDWAASTPFFLRYNILRRKAGLTYTANDILPPPPPVPSPHKKHAENISPVQGWHLCSVSLFENSSC